MKTQVKVPFKITVWRGHLSRDEIPTTLQKLYDAQDKAYHSESRIAQLKGWNVYTDKDTVAYGNILVLKIKKGVFTVYDVDESEHEDGIIQTFFADDQISLKAFCKDFGYSLEQIQENKYVDQMLEE